MEAARLAQRQDRIVYGTLIAVGMILIIALSILLMRILRVDAHAEWATVRYSMSKSPQRVPFV
jgi:hypothetical protein